MKYLRRYLSLLFALVMSLGIFSIPVLAASVDDTSRIRAKFVGIDQTSDFTIGETYIMSGESKIQSFVRTGYLFSSTKTNTFRLQITFTDTSGAPIFRAGEKYTFNASNIFNDLEITFDNGRDFIVKKFNRCLVYYTDLDHNTTRIDNGDNSFIEYDSYLESTNLKVTFIPHSDVHSLIFYLYMDFDSSDFPYNTGTNGYVLGSLNWTFGTSNNLKLDISIQSEESSWLEKISGGISNLVQGILDLPKKIWDYISDGLKSLFVPSAEDMVSYKGKWEELLSSRLGAVYQVVNIVTDSWDEVITADQTNTIDFPEVSINLPGESSFTFGGYEVQIVPAGFDFLVDAVKLIIGVVASIAFVNGMRKKYDEVMGVEK